MKKVDFSNIEPFKISNSVNKTEIQEMLENIVDIEKEFSYLSYLVSKINPESKEKDMKKMLTLIVKQGEKIDNKIENRDSIEISSRIKDEEYNHKINPFLVKPDMIAEGSSPRHIQSVLEHSLIILNRGNTLLKDVLTLNPKAGEIGAGKLLGLKLSAKKVEDWIELESTNKFDKRYKEEYKDLKKKSGLKNK